MRRDCLLFLFSFSEVGDDVRHRVFVTWVCLPVQSLKLQLDVFEGFNPKYTSSIVAVCR